MIDSFDDLIRILVGVTVAFIWVSVLFSLRALRAWKKEATEKLDTLDAVIKRIAAWEKDTCEKHGNLLSKLGKIVEIDKLQSGIEPCESCGEELSIDDLECPVCGTET